MIVKISYFAILIAAQQSQGIERLLDFESKLSNVFSKYEIDDEFTQAKKLAKE